MKKVNKLKDDARKYELREDWDKAINAYQRVLEMGEQEGDVDLPLYNRIGDLYVRVGKPNDAVRYYTQAADRYADAGLFNNAIALCNKALRYAPENLDLLRKLGQFSASQGFLTDARRWFLDYAESAARQGRSAEALQALEDFANSTEDAEVRELFGRTLKQHERHEQAVSELRHAYRLYLGSGDSERAESLAAYLGEIAPDVSLADEVPEERRIRESEDEEYVIRPYATRREADAAAAQPEAAQAEPRADETADADAETAAEPPGDESEGDVDSGQIEGLVETAIGDGAHADVTEADVLEGFQPTSFETEPEDESDALELPRLETAGADQLDEEAAFELPELEPTHIGEGTDEEDDVAFELPGLEPTSLDMDDSEGFVGGMAELPMLDDEEDEGDAGEEQDALAELPALDAEEAPEPLPMLDAGTDDTADAVEESDLAGADIDVDVSDAAPADTDVEYAVDEIELPTFDDAADTEDVEAEVPEPEAAELAVAEEPATDEPGADESAAGQHTAGEPGREEFSATEEVDVIEVEAGDDEPLDVEIAAGDLDTVFSQPLLSTDGEVKPDAEPPVVGVDHAQEAIDEVVIAARNALDRDDVAGAVGRLLSLHQVLDDAASYGRAAEEVGTLIVETPEEIRLHQVRVELAERSGDQSLRLGAYLSLAHALERSDALAKAAAIYEHVLEIEPDHAGARESLDAIERQRTPQYVDLKSLLDLDEPTGETRYFVTESNPSGDEDNDFAAVLSQFKAKLSEHVAPEDAEAHYDLGLAFKEMGLLDEAIEQFQVALRTGDGRLKVYEELGDCFLQKGQYSVAVKLIERALQLPAADEMDRVGLYYYLGAASEQLGHTDQARDAYERVLGLDMSFRDVSERLGRL
ncbi:MAG: tetratricopeptide repeat protein [Longimicrobiales bacterium]